MVKRVSAKEARNRFADLLGSVYYSKEAVIVEKQGRPFAVVISPEEYERFTRERQARFAILDELRARNPNLTPEEAEADAAREVAASRQERGRRAPGG